jgi:hypothetical protein
MYICFCIYICELMLNKGLLYWYSLLEKESYLIL